MSLGTRSESSPATDGPLADALVNMGRFLRPGETSEDLRAVFLQGGRAGDSPLAEKLIIHGPLFLR